MNIDSNKQGTCDWLRTSPEYERWLQAHGILLIRGHPGCGKSTLLKYISEKQSDCDKVCSPKTLTISFFFASGTDLQNSAVGFYRSLLYQLLKQDPELKPSFQEICYNSFCVPGKKERRLQWSQRELKVAFEKLLSNCASRCTIRIFIDAVDECKDQDREELIQLLHSYKGSRQDHTARIGICMTSRHHPGGQIDCDFPISLDERNREDISKYIEDTLRLPDETEKAKSELKSLLQTRARGSFLWLVWVLPRIHELCDKGVNVEAIKSDVERCPQQLNQFYEELLETIDETELSEAGRAFQWICFAARPLSLGELRVALTIQASERKAWMKEYLSEDNPSHIPNDQKMKKRLNHLSRGLVSFASIWATESLTYLIQLLEDFASTIPTLGQPRVGFYHESIKEFMLSKGLMIVARKLEYSHDPGEFADVELANTCFRHLSTIEVSRAMSVENKADLDQYIFHAYARDCWPSHAEKAESRGLGQKLEWPPQETLRGWIQQQHRVLLWKGFNAKGAEPIHIAAAYGLKELAKRIVGVKKKESHMSALQAPTKPKGNQRSYENAQTIVNKSVGTASKGGGRVFSPAQNVSRGVQQVKNMKSSTRPEHREESAVSARGRGRKVVGQSRKTAHHMEGETKPGHDNGTVSAEVDPNSITNIQDADGRTPLHWAAYAGRLEMVKLLLEHGADVRSRDKWNQAPLYDASRAGHLEVVKYLYKYAAADINATSTEGWTSLLSAANEGHLVVVKYLYEQGANINITADGVWTPLHVAASNGHLEVVEYLYEHADADIHSLDKWNATPLYYASAQGHLEVLKHLHKHGAKTNITANAGWTPLHAASEKGHLGVVQYLHDHEAKINVTTNVGWTPLHAATGNGQLEVVKYLHDRGAEMNITDNYGWTPLHAASEKGHLGVVQYLHDHEAKINVTTNDGWTLLHAATGNGHLEVVKYLHDRGAEMNITDNSGWTPLHAAAEKGHLEVVKYLHDRGAKMNISNKDGWTPLTAATFHGHLEVVKMLLRSGSFVNHVNQFRQTPLHHAIYYSNEAVASITSPAQVGLRAVRGNG